MNDVKQVRSQSRDCAEIKPQFYKPHTDHLIKATRPWERTSVDFKGPVKSMGKNRYLFTVVDEYSHFPFEFTYKNVMYVLKRLSSASRLCLQFSDFRDMSTATEGSSPKS